MALELGPDWLYESLDCVQLALARGVEAADCLLAGEAVPNRPALAWARQWLAAWPCPESVRHLVPRVRVAAQEFRVLEVAAGVCTFGQLPDATVAGHLRTVRRVLEELRREVAQRRFLIHAGPIFLESMPDPAARRRCERTLHRLANPNANPPAAGSGRT